MTPRSRWATSRPLNPRLHHKVEDPAGRWRDRRRQSSCGIRLAAADYRYEAYAPASQPRDYIAAAPHEDVDGMIVMDVEGPPNQLPVGTLIKARILEQLSTTGTVIGSDFSAELSEPVERNGRVPPSSGLRDNRPSDGCARRTPCQRRCFPSPAANGSDDARRPEVSHLRTSGRHDCLP